MTTPQDPDEPPLVVDVDDFLIPVDQPDPAPPAPAKKATKRSTAKAKRPPRIPAPDPDPAPVAADEPQQPLYDTMAAWFKGWYHRTIERQMSPGLVWCPQWWRHNEAISILTALWASWEGARVSGDPDAMIVWWERSTALLAHLTSADVGPFAACSNREHEDHVDLTLPYLPEPPEFFGFILDTGPDGYGNR
jgi:hypothetical protein